MAKKKESLTLKARVVYDPVSKRFIQKNHIVHGKKVLDYPVAQCKNCSEDYPKKRKNQKFCKTSCRMEYWIKKMHGGKLPDYGKAICPIDGVEFQKTREWSTYCSDECRAEGRKRKLAENRSSTLV